MIVAMKSAATIVVLPTGNVVVLSTGERCGSAHGERCGSVGASADQLFEGADLYGRPIHPLESENSG